MKIRFFLFFYLLFSQTSYSMDLMEVCISDSDVVVTDVFDSFSDDYLSEEISTCDIPKQLSEITEAYNGYFAHIYNSYVLDAQQTAAQFFSNKMNEMICCSALLKSCNHNTNKIELSLEQMSCSEESELDNAPSKNNSKAYETTYTYEDDYKYQPSQHIVNDPVKLERYGRFHTLINLRYKEAKKLCCSQSFKTMSAFKKHVTEHHVTCVKQNNKTVEQYYCSDSVCQECPYKSADAAISHFLHKQNPTLFWCPECSWEIKSYTAFYRHYNFNCPTLKKSCSTK